jgi:hypothetical protein
MGDLYAAQFVWVGSHWLRVLARCHFLGLIGRLGEWGIGVLEKNFFSH